MLVIIHLLGEINLLAWVATPDRIKASTCVVHITHASYTKCPIPYLYEYIRSLRALPLISKGRAVHHAKATAVMLTPLAHILTLHLTLCARVSMTLDVAVLHYQAPVQVPSLRTCQVPCYSQIVTLSPLSNVATSLATSLTITLSAFAFKCRSSL